MTKEELNILLDRQELKVPDRERDELLIAYKHIEKIAACVKKPLLDLIEPAHIVSFSKGDE